MTSKLFSPEVHRESFWYWCSVNAPGNQKQTNFFLHKGWVYRSDSNYRNKYCNLYINPSPSLVSLFLRENKLSLSIRPSILISNMVEHVKMGLAYVNEY